MEVGSQFYAVRPRTLDIVQNRSNHIYVTDLRWSRWTGGYGIHGLIPGTAQGTGVVHVTDRHSVRKATIYLSRVTNYGVNAFTYYDKMRIRGDPGVAQYWTWVNRSNRWVT